MAEPLVFLRAGRNSRHPRSSLRRGQPGGAKLVQAAWEWPRSSARAHTVDRGSDAVLDCRWAEYFGGWNFTEWQEMLAAAMPGDVLAAMRRAAATGEPLGSGEFVRSLEQRAGKRLRVLERGRPKSARLSCEDRARQGVLFAGE